MHWLFFAAASASGVALYNFAVKLSEDKISPMFGAVVMTVVSALILLAVFIPYKIQGGEVTYTNQGLLFAALAGLGIAVADISLFYVFTKGAPLSIVSPFIQVSAISVSVLLGIFFLKEDLSLIKCVGLVFSMVGLFLLLKE